MNIAFVGIEKDWEDLDKRDYTSRFIKFHLELPWYYASFGGNGVWIVTDCQKAWAETFPSGGWVCTQTPEKFKENKQKFDVVVHWRKWFEDMCRPEAVNVINSQDHSYGGEWLKAVEMATIESKLYGVVCFEGWHEENMYRELGAIARKPRVLSGVTLGVDTDIYKPHKNKSPYDLLWASDPGRGISGALEIAIRLFQKDKRYKLHVCWPDYYKGQQVPVHPAIEVHENLDNGPELWGLFNKCGFLPYTSTFKEPSST